jgi:predicted nucleic acid-binding protein
MGPPALLLDTGPWVALFHRPDVDHVLANRGFYQLANANTTQLAPLPVVFETYKWLLHEEGPDAARLCLVKMRQSAMFLYPTEEDFQRTAQVLADMPRWEGSLEDALVASMAIARELPVWTLNYRDFAAFSKLTFWTPS